MRTQTQQSFVALLHAAKAHDVWLNRTKIAKLLYLADLRAVESGWELFTGCEWRWRHFGPYDNALLEIEDHLTAQGVIDSIPTTNYYGSPEHRIRAKRLPVLRVEQEFREILFEVVKECGHLSASSLKDLTYQTPPMADAVEDQANEALLDFSDVGPAPEVAPTLIRLRNVVRAAGSDSDEPGAMEDLEEEVAVLSPGRRRANRELLD